MALGWVDVGGQYFGAELVKQRVHERFQPAAQLGAKTTRTTFLRNVMLRIVRDDALSIEMFIDRH